jgi:hypothetical protein
VAPVTCATFSAGDALPPLGIVEGTRIIDVRAIDERAPASLMDLIRGRPEVWRRTAGQAETLKARGFKGSGLDGRVHEAGGFKGKTHAKEVGLREFLQDGDIMETEVEGIGTMRNRLVSDLR